MKKLTAIILLFIIMILGGCGNMNHRLFNNEYTIPETIAQYTRIDTEPKTDWRARFIWDSSDGGEENVWMCFRKTVDLTEAPEDLTAFISADY